MAGQVWKAWSKADEHNLRWYAERRLSLRETAKLLDRSLASVLNKAVQLRIAFNGPPGAPFGNSNGSGTRFEPGNTAAARPPGGLRAGLCRACGVQVADTLTHYREVHQKHA